MSGKFMKTKRVILPTLVLVALLAQSSTAFALTPGQTAELVSSSPTVTMELAEVDAITMASPSIKAVNGNVVYAAANTSSSQNQSVSFTDLAGYDWAAPAIRDMASKGIVKGIGDNKYAPADNVTREQFASMILRSFGNDKVSQLAQQASDKAKTDSNYTSLDKLNETYKGNWSNEVICAIQMFPSLDTKWQCSKIYWGEEASRSDMALIIMTIAEQLGNEKFEIKEGIQNNIGDYSYVQGDSSRDEILKAYSAGILVGTNNQGYFSPDQLSNRAQAAVVMQRVIDPSKRTEVVVKEAEKPVIPPQQSGAEAGMHATYPKEGDVINGKTVTRDAETGILGLDVKGGIYLGIVTDSGRTLAVGSEASDTYDNMKMGDTYLSKGGYVLWGWEFNILHNYARGRLPVANQANAGKMADIKGNITTNSSEAFYKCEKTFLGDYQWEYQF